MTTRFAAFTVTVLWTVLISWSPVGLMAQPRGPLDDADIAELVKQAPGEDDLPEAEAVALTKKLLNPLNWWRLPGVYAAFVRNVRTDLTIIDAVALAPAVILTGPDNFDRRVFDATMYVGTTLNSGAQVRLPIWEGINPVIDEMFRR